MPTVEHVARRRREPPLEPARPKKRRRAEFPEPGAIEQLFREAKRNRA